MANDGFLDFSIGSGDEVVGKVIKRFKLKDDTTYRVTFAWFSVLGENGWDDAAAINDDGTLNPDAQIRFTGCERIYKENVGYILYKGPAYAVFGQPKQTVGTILVVWPTDKEGDLDATSFAAGKGYAVQPWLFSPAKYDTIKKSHKRFPLMGHDMSLACPADGGQFQKVTFTPEPENLFQKLLASKKPEIRDIVTKILADVAAVSKTIHGEMARDMTIDQIREKLGEDVETPTGSSGGGKDVEDLLNDVL
jgi:hypothetical protein